MTPELRAALDAAIPCVHADDVLDAIAPIIDAAIADAVDAERDRCGWGMFDMAVASCVRDALHAAADDLDTIAASAIERNGHIIAWAASFVRARANEGNPQ